MPVKILALHGYTQSGPGFQRKIQKLQNHLEKIFPDVQIHFPTGVIQLRPSEKALGTSFNQSEPPASGDSLTNDDQPDRDDIDAYAWHTLHDARDPPTGFEDSLNALADILRTEGPFDGILGFSQGALLAVMVASLLEGGLRIEAFKRAQEDFPGSFPYPLSFKVLGHPPLKFGITYGALMGRGKKYAAFYRDPLIHTPFIHFCGCWDPVVGIEMAQAVEDAQIGGDRCIRITHPGAHIVPLGLKYLLAVSDFIKNHCLGIKGLELTSSILERQHPLRLPMQLSSTSITVLRADSTPSESDDSALNEFENTYKKIRQRRVKMRHLSVYKAVRISRRASLEDSSAKFYENFTVEIQIFPSPREAIYISSSRSTTKTQPT